MGQIKLSNVYLDMVDKAYPHFNGFKCGYDHERMPLFSPATSKCSVNLYGIFGSDIDLSGAIPKTLGTYLIWKSKNTFEQTNIEDCTIQYTGPRLGNLIDISEYMEGMDTPEKKLLATKMMDEASLYWAVDDWYPMEMAFAKFQEEENRAMDFLESLQDGDDDDDEEEYTLLDYDYEDLEDEDFSDTLEEDQAKHGVTTLDLSDVSDEEYNRIMLLFQTLASKLKIIEEK